MLANFPPSICTPNPSFPLLVPLSSFRSRVESRPFSLSPLVPLSPNRVTPRPLVVPATARHRRRLRPPTCHPVTVAEEQASRQSVQPPASPAMRPPELRRPGPARFTSDQQESSSLFLLFLFFFFRFSPHLRISQELRSVDGNILQSITTQYATTLTDIMNVNLMGNPSDA